MNDNRMSEFEYEAMVSAAMEIDGALGERYVAHCNVTAPDCVVVQRCGIEGARLSGRVMVATIVDDDEHSPVILSAAHARKLAAALLNAADELDGKTVLAFMPDCPKCEAPEPDIERGSE